MKTEKEKMLAGEFYDVSDPELASGRLRARKLLARLDAAEPDDFELKAEIFRELFGSCGDGLVIEPPFRCDYGRNIFLGARVLINFNGTMLDVCRITIGDDTLLAPNVQLYTATHPLDWRVRKNNGPEFGKPISIGSDCWLGGGAIVCPGVTIGDRSVVGAGSVVTKDVPPDSLVVGNPARIVRRFA